MANGIRLRGISGEVSSVSVQSSVNKTWALIGRKWAGLRYKEHDVSLQRDELVAIRCQQGTCVLEVEVLGDEHGDIIMQEDVSRMRLRRGDRRRVTLERDGAAIVFTCTAIKHPFHRHGPIIET